MSLLMIDMDGTLRQPLSGQPYFQHAQDQQIIAGVDVALRAYQDDWVIVGITNQGGVAAGYKTMRECIQEQQYTLQLVPELKEIYFCPDFEGRKCFRVTRHNAHNHSQTKWFRQYRKPQPGMLKLAMVRHNQLPEDCLYVGDRPEDEEAARRAGIAFEWAEDWIARHQITTVRPLEDLDMTNIKEQYNDYVSQGQQDDYFVQDLAIAGHELPENSQDDNPKVEDYMSQGQQDDYFVRDLAIAAHETSPRQDEEDLEDYAYQGQQDDYFVQDLLRANRAQP